MPSGERGQVWYPELVDLLRRGWRPDASWDDVVQLRDQLQTTLENLRRDRGIAPPTFRCPRCGVAAAGAQPRISVRAMLISLRRFGIADPESVRRIEARWARYRQEHHLDLYGRRPEAASSSAPNSAHPTRADHDL
jgi:hypothetical protein